MDLINRDMKHVCSEKRDVFDLLVYCVAGLALTFATVCICTTAPKLFAAHTQAPCTMCHNAQFHNKEKLSSYFKRKGSPEPEVMADAVLRTKNPRLLAAVATCETGGNHRVRSRGYKSRHDGAFQVNPRDWGKVSPNAADQALQAEAILKELVVEKGGIVAGLNAYGGDSKRKVYAKNILSELAGVPK